MWLSLLQTYVSYSYGWWHMCWVTRMCHLTAVARDLRHCYLIMTYSLIGCVCIFIVSGIVTFLWGFYIKRTVCDQSLVYPKWIINNSHIGSHLHKTECLVLRLEHQSWNKLSEELDKRMVLTIEKKKLTYSTGSGSPAYSYCAKNASQCCKYKYNNVESLLFKIKCKSLPSSTSWVSITADNLLHQWILTFSMILLQVPAIT